GDRVIAAECHEHSTARTRLPRRRLDRRHRTLLAGPHHRHIAQIDHPHSGQHAPLCRDIPVAGWLAIGPEREAQRRLAYLARAVARAATQARAAIPRHPQHHHVGCDRAAWAGQRGAAEARDSVGREEGGCRHTMSSLLPMTAAYPTTPAQIAEIGYN